MNCKNCKNWVFGRCVVSNLVVGPDMLCNAWELSQSHDFVETAFASFSPDELQKRIAELEYKASDNASSIHAIISVLDVNDETQGFSDNMYDTALELAHKLRTRVTELEAAVKELMPYRDGYDATKVFPPKGQWVWLRDCDDNIEPVQYDHKAGFYWNYSTNTDGEPFCYWENNNVDIRRWYPMPDLPEEVQE